MITAREDLNQKNLAAEMEQLARRLNLEDIRQALYFPKYYQIETVRVCNARCPFCAIDQWDKSVPVMADGLFEKIAAELSEYAGWIESVCIQRAGEPLLDKKIVQRTRRLKEAGIKKITMATNASMLTEEKAIGLLSAGLDDILLSIDSIDKEIYEKMRVGLNYEIVMRNIETLFRVRNEISPEAIIRVRGVSFYDLDKEDDRHEIARWEEFWGRLKKSQDRIYMKQLHNWGNQLDVKERTEGRAVAEYGDTYHPCISPWSTMNITAMGIVALCCMDYDAKFDLGDINRESIAEVWHNDKWARIRQLHQSGNRNDINLCRGCKVFDLDFSLEKKGDKMELVES